MRITTSRFDMHVDVRKSGRKPGLLLLHGFLGSGADWKESSEFLSRDRPCFMPDLPWHGTTRSDDPQPGSFEEAAGEVAEMAKKISPEPCHLAGYSMGGRIGLYLALRYPEQFRSATIISASPGLKTPGERALRRQSDERVTEKILTGFESFLGEWYRMPLFEPLRAHSSFSAIIERRRENDPESLVTALRILGTGRQPSLWNTLRGNRLPLRFFAGEKDTKYVEIGRQLVNLCPCSELVVFPDCGHTPHLENRSLFLERLTGFLDTVEGRSG